ncbi:MAG: PAS domain S-box protein [Magnetococcales bacterium]|nr:PAS domain S-box protein [Magnetococcales bacterium]NGZ27841.1 PAS domain S-box protein [Magnetococcales bacterium]
MDDTRLLWKKIIKALGRYSGSHLFVRRLIRRLEQVRLLHDEGQRRLQNLRYQQQELARSEQKYFALFDQNPQAQLLVDRNSRITEVNQNAIALLGMERAALLGTLLTDHVDISDLSLWQDWLSFGDYQNPLQLQITTRLANTAFNLHAMPLVMQGQDISAWLISLEKMSSNHPLLPLQGSDNPFVPASDRFFLLDAEGRIQATGGSGLTEEQKPGNLLLQTVDTKEEPLLRHALANAQLAGLPQCYDYPLEDYLHSTPRWTHRVAALTDGQKQTKGYLIAQLEISDRLLKEHRATMARQRIFSLLDALPAFVYLQNRQRVIQYANTAFRTIFGEVEGGRTCWQIFHPLGHHCDVCHGEKVFSQGVSEQWEVTDRQGRVYMVHDSLFTEEGWEPLMMGVGLEITPRIQAEEALARSEHRFQALARMAPVGIFRTDIQGNWIFVNPRWEEITGLTVQQAAGCGWLQAVHPQDREPLLTSWQKALAEPQPLQAEFRLQKTTGDILWVICQATPDVDEIDGFVGLVGTITDISERRIMEEALSESNRRYRAIVEDQTELIGRFQPDGSLTFVNEAYCRYFNQPRETLLGSHFLHHVLEETKAAIGPKLAELTRSSPVVAIEHQSFVGEVRWQKWTYRAIFTLDGQLAEYQAVGRDITEDKKIQEAILHLKDELELQERKRLAITLHDGVGQSMQAINLGLKLAATTFPHNPNEALKTLREMSREITETIAQLRDITGELRPSFLERMELVEAMRWWGGRVAERSRVEVRIQPRTELPPLSLRIKYNCFQIFQEALTNAIKHSGSKEVIVTLEHTVDDHLKMEIMDRGKGFDPNKEGGVSQQGLGLSIIPERVARMGGTLNVRSEPGRGVVISVLVPSGEKECTGRQGGLS